MTLPYLPLAVFGSPEDNKNDSERVASPRDPKTPPRQQHRGDEQYVAMVQDHSSDDSVEYDYADKMTMTGFSRSKSQLNASHKPPVPPPREHREGRKRVSHNDGAQPQHSRPVLNSSKNRSTNQPHCNLTRVLPPTQEHSPHEVPALSHGEERGKLLWECAHS